MKATNRYYQYYNSGTPERKIATIDKLLSYHDFDLEDNGLDLLDAYVFVDEIRINHVNVLLELISELKKFHSPELIKNSLKESIHDLDLSGSTYNLFSAFNQDFAYTTELRIFEKREFQQLVENRFERYLSTTQLKVDQVYELFYSCWERVENNNVHLTKKAYTLMRKYASMDPFNYLNSIIRPKYSGYTYSRRNIQEFVFEPFLERVFSSWSGFKEYLASATLSSVPIKNVESINLFFELYQSSGYRSFEIANAELSNHQHIPIIDEVYKQYLELGRNNS